MGVVKMPSSLYGNYLAHYGVLGMKWGVHRAKVNQAKAADARAKGDAEKAAKYTNKAKNIEQKHIDRTDRKTYNKVKNISTVELVGQSLVLSTYGALKYNQALASGMDFGESILTGILGYGVNTITGGIYSLAEPRNTAYNKKKARAARG